jgi:hypothetical protein
MSKEKPQDEIKNIEFNEKQEPIDLDSGKPEPEADEGDPRTAIYRKHAEKRKAEGEGTLVGTEKPSEEDPAPADLVEKAAEPEPEEEVMVKVNGKEKMVPKSKIEAAGGIEAYRKNAAASELLNQASAERREVEARKLQLDEQERQLTAEREEFQRARHQPALVSADGMKELAHKYHAAIMDGEMDKASELLLQMQSARGDVGEIAKQAAAEARATIKQEQAREQQIKFEVERREAVEWFAEEFSDISGDDELRSMADRKTIELMEAHPDWGPRKVIEESARSVRDWMGNKGIGNKLPSDKLEAKRTLSVVKGGSARAVPRQASKLPTNSQYIENLRKLRGLDN